jgi:hypothetical protein
MTDAPTDHHAKETEEGFGALHQGKPKRDVGPHETSKKRPHSDDERLDEGLEETFPASDPVSAKHIT